MNEETLQRIAKQYGLVAVSVSAPQKGYRNESYRLELTDKRLLNFIKYKREPGIVGRIRRANAVGDFAAEHGYPARATASPRLLRLQAGSRVSYGALYAYLPGATIPWEAYTMRHIKALGAGLSDLHAVLATAPEQALPNVVDECSELCGRMSIYFDDPGVQHAMKEKLQLTTHAATFAKPQKLLAETRKLGGQQALHMDFVRGNILFNEQAEITGVLDFEKTAVGPPIFDIARTLAFLLVDCKYKDEQKVRKYFLYSGYAKRGKALLPHAPQTLQALTTFFLLHDFYKFLRHNPYETLKDNEHYTRTRDFLLKRNIIRKVQMLQ